MIASLEVELNDRTTEYVDNFTGERVTLEPIKPVKPAAIMPAPVTTPATTDPAAPATAPAATPAKTTVKPAAQSAPRMVYNPVTDEMEEASNCDGFCGLPDGLKLDGKNLFE